MGSESRSPRRAASGRCPECLLSRAPGRAPGGSRGCRTGSRARANGIASRRLDRLAGVKAICLVKQVPALGAIEFDEETKSLKREGVPAELNPFDRYAVQYGALLADENVVMTMGPPQAEEALRECLALGADRAIHLSDRVFAVADTIGTSRTLALAIEREGAVDLVVAGRKTTDSET